MIYHGATFNFGTTYDEPIGNAAWNLGYAEIGLARSTENGLTWTRQGAIVSGGGPKPSTSPKSLKNGVVEPGAIVTNDYIYVFCSFFPTSLSSAEPEPTI